MKISKTGYKKNSKDRNEPALVIPSNQITMKDVEFPVYGMDDTGYSQMMYPGLDYLFPGNYVYELPMAKDGMSVAGSTKVIGGKLEIGYDSSGNVLLKPIDSDSWTRIEGEKAKEFKTKFAKYMPGYFSPTADIEKLRKEAANKTQTKKEIIVNEPNEQKTVVKQESLPLQEIAKKEKKSFFDISFGDKTYNKIFFPENRDLESGVVVDKHKNEVYVLDKGKILKKFPAITGQAKDYNYSDYTTDYLESHPQYRSTPLGSYFLAPSNNIYGNPGFYMEPISAYGTNAPVAKNIAMHTLYGLAPKGQKGHDPKEGKRRLDLMSGPGENRNASYGCVNLFGKDICYLTNTAFPEGDTAIVVDSRKRKDFEYLNDLYQRTPIYSLSSYDKGGITAPGRFRNPEGNWLSKYQDGSQVKTYESDPAYFDNRAVFVDNPQANDLVRSKVYSGTHGWDPTTNSLVKLDKPVAVPKSVQEMSTADWGKKSSKERFESNTPAGRAIREKVVANNMADAMQNPYFRGAIPAMLAAPLVAGAAPIISTALNAPLTIGSTVIPGASIGNALGAVFAADALLNRLPKLPGQIDRGEYTDAAVNAATGVLDLYGANMVSPVYKGFKEAAQETGKFLTTQTPLKNTYKLNPQAKGSLFNPWGKDMSYRVVNQAGYDDAIKNFLVRSNPNGDNALLSRHTNFPSFAKGKPSKNFLNTDNTPHYIMETDIPLYARGEINPVTGLPIKGSHGAARPIDPVTGETLTSIPIEDINTIYNAKPHWLQGYESIWKSPTNIKDLNDIKIGKNIATSGAFNRGVYELPDYPGYLLKYEDTNDIRNVAIPNIDNINYAALQKNINSSNIGKVVAHLKKQKHAVDPRYSSRDMEAYVLKRMPGKHIEDMSIDELKEIPKEAWLNYSKDYEELVKNNLAVDNIGSNVLYNPADQRFKIIDLSPASNKDITQEWSNYVLDGISPTLSDAELKSRIGEITLGKIDRITQSNIDKFLESQDHNPLDNLYELVRDMNLKGDFTKNMIRKYLRENGYKKGGVKSSAEGYYDYINGYSGVYLSDGGSTASNKSWLNKYK